MITKASFSTVSGGLKQNIVCIHKEDDEDEDEEGEILSKQIVERIIKQSGDTKIEFKFKEHIPHIAGKPLGLEYISYDEFSEDKNNVSLMEVYHSNEDAIFHMNAFAEAPHRDKFLETFIVSSFQVLGDTNAELKEALKAYTDDHRMLVDGFQRNK